MQIKSILTTNQLMFSQSPSCVPCSQPLLVSVLSMASCGVGYILGRLGWAVPSVSTPSCLCTPSLLTGGMVLWGEDLVFVWAQLSYSSNIPVLPTLFPSPIPNMAPINYCEKKPHQLYPRQNPHSLQDFSGCRHWFAFSGGTLLHKCAWSWGESRVSSSLKYQQAASHQKI